MTNAEKARRANQFVAAMIRCRGIEFARLGMMVEVDGDRGIIEGINANSNLNVRFSNQFKHKGVSNCHPTWNVKYFDENENVIAHFDESKCVLRPERAPA